jgi:hypothetical protein
MSSGLELNFVEFQPGAWYWIRQSSFCPVECWDWREHDPDVVGPFASYEAADESYCANERNTGGCSIIDYGPKHAQDKALVAAIAAATAPTKYYSRWERG